MENRFRAIYGEVLAARHPLLVAHAKPDGDALGAVLAFGRFLESRGRLHTRFCIDPVPPEYAFMPGVERMIHDEAAVRAARPDLAVIFDSGDLAYAGVERLLSELGDPPIINIDHHGTNRAFGRTNVVVPEASSTAEIVHRFFSANQIDVDREMATCLLTGICFDTFNFSNPGTSAAALGLGAELLRRGARFSAVQKYLLQNKSVTTLRLWGVVLSRLTWNAKYGVAATVIRQDDLLAAGADEEAIKGISNFLNNVLNVPTVLVLTELPGGFVRGSFRTTGELDVAKISRAFGGGGHRKAAGFTIKASVVEKNGEWRIESGKQ